MKRLLHIETATQVCSVSISEGEKILAFRESREANIHSKKLSSFIEEIINETGITIPQLDAVSVSIGPGSYTGLRIGVSTAKGIAYGGHIPVITLGSLDVLANMVITDNLIPEITDKTRQVILCPMIDARRMEVYCKLLSEDLHELSDIEAKVIDQNSFLNDLTNKQLVFFGDGSDKCRSVIKHPNAHFLPGIYPSSKYMVSLALQKFEKKDFVETAYFEPFYLKDFIATVPRNKILPNRASSSNKKQ